MPCCELPWPAKTTLFGAGSGVPVVLIDGIGQVGADEVALDRVADVGGIGDLDADPEASKGQAADDAVRGGEDETRSIRRCGFRR